MILPLDSNAGNSLLDTYHCRLNIDFAFMYYLHMYFYFKYVSEFKGFQFNLKNFISVMTWAFIHRRCQELIFFCKSYQNAKKSLANVIWTHVSTCICMCPNILIHCYAINNSQMFLLKQCLSTPRLEGKYSFKRTYN